jgi:hypothetical protein
LTPFFLEANRVFNVKPWLSYVLNDHHGDLSSRHHAEVKQQGRPTILMLQRRHKRVGNFAKHVHRRKQETCQQYGAEVRQVDVQILMKKKGLMKAANG